MVRYSNMDETFNYDDDSDDEDEYEETRYAENQKLVEEIAKFMARIPDLRPSTVLDVLGLTLPAARLNPTVRPPSVGEGGFNFIRPHVTRLVSTWHTFHDSLAPQMEVPAAERRTRLRAVYPDLVEVVLHLFQEGLDLSLLKTLLFLVEEGYKVVLAGYQEQNHDWDRVRETPLAETPIHIPIPNHDQLVDNLVNRVKKISLREFFALPLIQFYYPAYNAELLIKAEEDHYKRRSITMRYNL